MMCRHALRSGSIVSTASSSVRPFRHASRIVRASYVSAYVIQRRWSSFPAAPRPGVYGSIRVALPSSRIVNRFHPPFSRAITQGPCSSTRVSQRTRSRDFNALSTAASKSGDGGRDRKGGGEGEGGDVGGGRGT